MDSKENAEPNVANYYIYRLTLKKCHNQLVI